MAEKKNSDKNTLSEKEYRQPYENIVELDSENFKMKPVANFKHNIEAATSSKKNQFHRSLTFDQQ